MDEKKLSVILEAVADKIQTLGLDLTVKDIKIRNLTEENERLKRENDILKAENKRYQDCSPVVFKKIERFDNGKL